ncbi:hypothetical protein D9619_012025 [Psilocybe cf. subviscida]|uniref:Uncharacterized protein n=1 Tax=Psilocybe cf. subviscida TaxID=2480587 RepID=A0A8H5EZG4_9AGAR|nr:hypothetical protein D9619_012025 [Psilocybe cf. subviscida]
MQRNPPTHATRPNIQPLDVESDAASNGTDLPFMGSEEESPNDEQTDLTVPDSDGTMWDQDEISSESDSDRPYHVGSDFELTEISQEDLDLPEEIATNPELMALYGFYNVVNEEFREASTASTRTQDRANVVEDENHIAGPRTDDNGPNSGDEADDEGEDENENEDEGEGGNVNDRQGHQAGDKAQLDTCSASKDKPY